METLSLGSVKEIPTTEETVFAFDIDGHVPDDDAEALARYMNVAFDHFDKVNMLMVIDGYEGSDKDAIFDADVLESRWRSLFNVEKYAVVGAPESAEKMITFMDKLVPIDAKTFSRGEEAAAWEFVGAARRD